MGWYLSHSHSGESGGGGGDGDGGGSGDCEGACAGDVTGSGVDCGEGRSS